MNGPTCSPTSMNASTAEGAALALFQAGRFVEAEAAWRAILAQRPDDAHALHLLGLVLARTGRSADGLALLDRAVALAPGDAAVLNNRGTILAQLGRLADAEVDVRRALHREPRFTAALAHLGSLLRRQGKLEEATAAFRKALQQDPRQPDAHVGLGNTLRERGDVPGAMAAYAAALALDPRHAGAHYNRGNAALELGDLAAAESAFRASLAADPRNAIACNNLGVTLRRAGQLAEAREAFEQALVLDPMSADALNNLGLVLALGGDAASAAARFAQAVELRPGFAGALTNWGNVRKDGGDLAGAAALYERALEAAPAFADALNNRANVALDQGDLDLAKALYSRAAAAQPGFVDPNFSLAQVALFEHDFARGWEGYELRFETSHPMATRRPFAAPRLDAALLAKRPTVAVPREQGVGDQVLFATLLPELVAAGARPVVDLDPRLLGAMRRAIPGVTFVAPEEAAAAFAACDAQLPLGSLPGWFRRDAASFSRQPRAMLAADPARVAKYRERLGDGHWVAVSWRSIQKRDRRDLERRKSMPVQGLGILASIPGVRLLDVQYGEVSGDRAAFEALHPGAMARLEGLDVYEDLDGLMAALAACAEVVTVSNVNAHFAGALGLPTRLLYPGNRPPFHYWAPLADGKSPWYPSVEVVSGPGWGWEQVVAEAGRRVASGL